MEGDIAIIKDLLLNPSSRPGTVGGSIPTPQRPQTPKPVQGVSLIHNGGDPSVTLPILESDEEDDLLVWRPLMPGIQIKDKRTLVIKGIAYGPDQIEMDHKTIPRGLGFATLQTVM